MGKLDAEQRNKMPKKEFGLPNQKKYPINDKGHAKAALSRAKHQENIGALSKGAYQHISGMAHKKLAGRGS